METNIQEKAEAKIIDLIEAESDGRLVTYKPENSDKDLVVEKKGDYKKIPISFTVYCQDRLSPHGSILELIDKQLPAEQNSYVLAVVFDIVTQDIQDSLWLIPSEQVAGLTEEILPQFLSSKKDLGKFLVEQLVM